MSRQTIRIAHSPDSDDAFMFYALATGRLVSDEFEFVQELHDIETLNRAARKGRYEVSAVSIHGYAYVQESYALLNSGASMGEGYGPLVVSAEPLAGEDLAGREIAVPGTLTSAYLALKLFAPGVCTRTLPFDEIMAAVKTRNVAAGVLIHEGQLTYEGEGLQKVVDLGAWWKETTGLPLPLGGNVIRRDLGAKTVDKVARLIRDSIACSLDRRHEALNYALSFGRGLDAEQGDRFVRMYVNERTLDCGEEGRQAVRLFLEKGFEAGIIPHRVEVDFV